MPDAPLPASLDVPLSALADLATQWWRLTGALAKSNGGGAAARHALGRIEDLLRRCELEVGSLEGRAFDPGLAVRVVDTMDDASLAPGEAVIAQTVSPLILWRGQVIRVSDVVTRRGPERSV